MTNHLTVDSVVDLLIDIQENLSHDKPMTLSTQMSHLGVQVSIMEFLENRSELFNKRYEKKLTERFPENP